MQISRTNWRYQGGGEEVKGQLNTFLLFPKNVKGLSNYVSLEDIDK